MLHELEERNQKIINAVIEKARRGCPDSLALIGIYGSFMTGDVHEKSDLDLLILINDDNGWQLGCAFIQEDLQVGHDIYCTSWESLEWDADYEHPNISKLMDSKVVYCADEKYVERLEALREKAREKRNSSFSKEDYEKGEKLLKEAEHFYVRAVFSQSLLEMRKYAGGVLYYIENAIAMLNKKYFRFGTKRVYEELAQMEKRPESLCEMLEAVVMADTVELLKIQLEALLRAVIGVFDEVKTELEVRQKAPVTADSIRGTYEEMYSNWRNKMYVAAKENQPHLAFASMCSLDAMLSEIRSGVEIGTYDVFKHYNSHDLAKTASGYDEVLKEYLKEYQKAGLEVKGYSDIDAFVKDYLKGV